MIVPSIRDAISANCSVTVAHSVKITYGGSVSGNTISLLISKPNLDSELIGAATLKATSFCSIANAA